MMNIIPDNILLILPILIPPITALIAMSFWSRPSIQRIVSVVGATLLLVVSVVLLFTVWQHGILAVQIANWQAPFGITIVADLMSAIMVVMTGLIGFSVAVYSLAGIDPKREAYGYHALVHFLLMGVSGAFLTGDLFNLYVWFEVMLISSFVLVALGGTPQQIQGAVKYVTLSLMASMLFLAGVGVIYGATGALNMAALHNYFSAMTSSGGILLVIALLFTIAFGIKSAIFPLFFWLPASYHTGPVVVSALFAGLLTKVGVYALVRVYTLLFAPVLDTLTPLLLALATLTMLIGVLGAVAQGELRRLLSFHIISQIGYMIMGLALFTPLALAGVLYFLVHNILAKTNLFLISGLLAKVGGTEQLSRLGGFYQKRPGWSILFLIAALALAGVPPLSGFWAKFMLVQAGLQTEQYLVVGVSLLVSVLTLYSMTKIWAEAFWKEAPENAPTPRKLARTTEWTLLVPIALLAVLTLGMGLAVEPVIDLSNQAAYQLLNPEEYVNAVLGPQTTASLPMR